MNRNNFITSYKKNHFCKTFIIAEAGVHHNCSIDLAKKIIDAAANAGADAIKFQTYKSETLVTNWAPIYWKQKNQLTQFQYFKKRDKFNFEDYECLNNYARQKNIIFCSTPFDDQSVTWLEKLNVPFWKIASGDIDNYSLLEKVSKTNKPVIISTGASFFNEIRDTVHYLQTKKVKKIALLHCNLAYPTPDNEANLLRITKLKSLFPNLLIGYSDHTIPDNQSTIPVLAVALGAKIIEKHFTLNREIPEDDHLHSVDPILLERMIKKIKIAEDSTGEYAEMTESEKPARKNARRSLVANENISKGTVMGKNMIIPKRPGGGISPSMIDNIVGKKAVADIPKDSQILFDDLE